jgi:integrase/recombinase XerC
MNQAKFIDYLRSEKNYSRHTITAYQKDLEDFTRFCELEFDQNTIDKLPYSIVRSWIVLLVDSGISNRSINRKMASLKAYYKFLMHLGVLKSTPFAKHKALKITQKVAMPFSVEEMQKMLSEIPFKDDFEGIRDKLIIELLYATGIRRDELINLKIRNVHFSPDTIKVLGKRNKERIIPLIPKVSSLIKEYIIQRNNLEKISDSDFLFLLKSGYKIYDSLVYRIINHYFSIVTSKEKKSPHILRHTFATHLLNQGADLNAVKELLGHASLSSTQVYTHNSIAALKKVHSAAHPRSKK